MPYNNNIVIQRHIGLDGNRIREASFNNTTNSTQQYSTNTASENTESKRAKHIVEVITNSFDGPPEHYLRCTCGWNQQISELAGEELYIGEYKKFVQKYGEEVYLACSGTIVGNIDLALANAMNHASYNSTSEVMFARSTFNLAVTSFKNSPESWGNKKKLLSAIEDLELCEKLFRVQHEVAPQFSTSATVTPQIMEEYNLLREK